MVYPGGVGPGRNGPGQDWDRDGAVDPRARDHLRALGSLDDDAIDLTEAALHIALLLQPGADLDPYRALLADMTAAVGGRNALGLSDRAAALAGAIAGDYGFSGDAETYDDLANASLIRVIDRRKGLPITLAILYLHVGRALGWPIHGLGFPGHFLVALDGAGGRAILDPFDGGAPRQPHELRALAKRMQGPEAELSPALFAPAGNRAILTRLQNNLRTRLVRQGAFEPALLAAEAVTWFNPHDAAAWRDMGMLHAELGNLRAALMTLEESLGCDDQPSRRHLTAALIQKLRQRLN
ncbi:MAG: tetratricopeptide repeat protein [Alphaproteobacteria bacterium]